MVTTRQVDEPTLSRSVCVLCGQHFQLPSGAVALPTHVYPTGLFRGRRCASASGIPA